MRDPDEIHNLGVGQIGYVFHTLNLTDLIGYTRAREPEEHFRDWMCLLWLAGDFAIMRTHHIPHSTPVLILSHPYEVWSPSAQEKKQFYQVLWVDLVCFVERRYVYNPYPDRDP